MALSTGSVFTQFKADVSSFRKGIKEARNQTQEFRGAVKETGRRMNQFGTNFNNTAQRVSGATTRMTAVVGGLSAAVGVLSGKAFVNFQNEMKNVQAITSASEEEFEKLKKTAKEMGRTTQFSASQAARGLKFLGQAGFETKQSISSLPKVLDLAAAGNMELGKTADIASNILSSYRIKAENAGRVTDVLAQAARKSNTNISELGIAFEEVGAVAKGAGISFEETTAALGLLADNGIKGSKAGTALKNVFARLQDPTKAVKEGLKGIGLSTDDLIGSDGKIKSLTEIVKQLNEAGATSADVMKIFGRESGPQLAALVAEGSESVSNLTQKLKNSKGVAETMANTQMEGLQGAMKTLKSALEGLQIELFSGKLQKAANGAVRKMTQVINGLTDALSKSNKEVGGLRGKVESMVSPIIDFIKKNQKLVGTLAAIAAGALSVAAGLSPILVSLSSLVTVIGAILSPAGALVAVLIGLGGAFAGGMVKSEKFREKVKQTANNIKASVVPAIKKFWGWIQNRLVPALKEIWAKMAKDLVPALGKVWGWVKDRVVPALQKLWNNVKTLIPSVKGLKKAWDVLWPVLKFVGKLIGETIITVLKAFVGVINTVVNAFQAAWNTIQALVALIKGDTDKAKKKLKQAWQEIKDTAQSALKAAWNIFKLWIGKIFKFLFRIPGRIFKFGRNQLGNAFKSAWNFAVSRANKIIGNFVGGIKHFFGKRIPNVVRNLASRVKNSFRDFIKAGIDKINEMLQNLVGGFVHFFTNKIPNAIRGGIGAVKDAISDFLTGANEANAETVQKGVPTDTTGRNADLFAASGGIVPGQSFTGDRKLARVNSGEMILNRQQQAQLFEMANGASENGGSTYQITINADSATNARAVADQVEQVLNRKEKLERAGV